MKHEAAVIAQRQRHILIAHQYIRVLVEDMAVASLVLLVYLIVVTLSDGYMYAVFGCCEQCIVDCQQHIERLRCTREEEVATDGNFLDIHLPAYVDSLLPVGLECRDVIFRYVYIVQ